MMRLSDEYYAFIPHHRETIPEEGDVILSGDPDGGRPLRDWRVELKLSLGSQ
ncbi:hypothetical protein [Synechococcus sp. WH 8016]|uniref:hypothetical protein n=1 Tax=Synechococcus sp. WH 8016 TaxID=166318 RepID=UPI000237D72B|nr:hypothetical protein [Synechococcus sp. WH 8016]EHA61927.1 hypothetical protein Syn8016DRAFT_1999 [Synechococcus sp. WH 8016]